MKRAFTLIELLVVISIISLLGSIVASTFQEVRASARDAQRLSDMKQYQVAIEQSRLNNSGNAPVTTQFSYLTPANYDTADIIAKLVDSEILAKLIFDPVHNTGYNGSGYVYQNSDFVHVWTVSDNDPSTYLIRFITETTTTLGPAGYYCLTSKGIHKAGTDVRESNQNYRCAQD